MNPRLIIPLVTVFWRRFQKMLDVNVFGQIILIFHTVGGITCFLTGNYTQNILFWKRENFERRRVAWILAPIWNTRYSCDKVVFLKNFRDRKQLFGFGFLRIGVTDRNFQMKLELCYHLVNSNSKVLPSFTNKC